MTKHIHLKEKEPDNKTNKCEICDDVANQALIDKNNNLRYCCVYHEEELWRMLGKP